MKWSRPENITFPQIWWRFSGKDPETGDVVNYRIEDLAEDRYAEIVDIMVNIFVNEEPMLRSLDFPNDEVSLKEMRKMWEHAVSQKLTLICYKEGSTEICGFNILEMNFKSDSMEESMKKVKGEGVINLLKSFDYIKKKGNVYERYNVDKYLHGLGLMTMHKYRKCGIATELLKARFPMMKALGLTLTCTVFSGPGSQGAATKAGFTDDVVVSYESLGKEFPFVPFPNISWPVVKFMCYHME